MSENLSKLTIEELIQGFQITQIVYTVTKLKIPDLLSERPATLALISDKLSIQPDLLDKLLHLAIRIGILDQNEDEQFLVNEKSRALTSFQENSLLHDSVIYCGEYLYRTWGNSIVIFPHINGH